MVRLSTSQIGSSFLGISWYILLTSQISQCHLGAGWYASGTPRLVSLFYVPVGMFFLKSQIGHFHLGTR